MAVTDRRYKRSCHTGSKGPALPVTLNTIQTW
jgi:hypothetical protein